MLVILAKFQVKAIRLITQITSINMKRLFSWRLPLSESDFAVLWEQSIFVFDTNFLLDLYRVSRSTANDFLKILEHLQDRIWLPYQVADEFLRQREEIIEREALSFQQALSRLEEWKDEQYSFKRLRGVLENSGRIVAAEVEFLYQEQQDFLSAIDKVEHCFKEKIEALSNTHSVLSSQEDPILEKILSLFDNKVGESYSEDKLQKIYKEGEIRYSKEIPPGFKDINVKKDERKYGDYILWKQVIDFASKVSKPIIFVTRDEKEDWWIKKEGKIISPRIELRCEFQKQVKQLFWMYLPKHFFELAREKLEVEVKQESIDEAEVIAHIEEDKKQTNALNESAQSKSVNELVQTIELAETLQHIDRQIKSSRIAFPEPELLKIVLGISEQIQSLNPTFPASKLLEIMIEMNEQIQASTKLPPTLDFVKPMEQINEGVLSSSKMLSALPTVLSALPTVGERYSTTHQELRKGPTIHIEQSKADEETPEVESSVTESQQTSELDNQPKENPSIVDNSSKDAEERKSKTKRQFSKRSGRENSRKSY